MYFLSKPRHVGRSADSLASVLPPRYLGFSRISDDTLARIEDRYGSVEAFMSTEFLGDSDSRGNLGLQTAIEQILSDYVEARTNTPFGSDHPMFELFQRVTQAIANLPVVKDNSHLRVKFSAGQGNWARVPWIAVLDDRETATVQQGVYAVYLFREDCTGVYATLNQGVTDPIRRRGVRQGISELRATAERLRSTISDLGASGFLLDDAIELRSRQGLGQQYQAATIAYKFYPAGAVPTDGALVRDLQALLSAYEASLSPRTEPVDLTELAPAFASALEAAHVRFGLAHDRVVRSFLASILTKPLVILTGLSGSGKTQIALKFGEWMGADHMELVAVRPDWTGPEALFGYEDVLRPRVEGQPVWAAPDALKFMLKTAHDPAHLYVLILDEMNLAHVERYFSDFLSASESGQEIIPNLVHENGSWVLSRDEGSRLAVPRNLVVIGTVNVDETTYMFSPKVLDRANTIEFRVATDDLQAAPQKPVVLESADPAVVASLVNTINDDGVHLRPTSSPDPRYQETLRQLHRLLSTHDAEFGFRSFYDSQRYAAIYKALGESDWEVALDLQVLQKVLPRLHGARRKLEPILEAVGRFCFDLRSDLDVGFDVLVEQSEMPRLPISYGKVQRMMRNLRANQFASFTD
jgi:5-methylcytosine-specific restriction enzyme B